MKNKTLTNIMIIIITSVIAMYLVDGVFHLSYLNKSIIKISMFLLLPVAYSFYDKNILMKNYFTISNIKKLAFPFLLGLGVFVVIITTYFILRNFIELDQIRRILEANANINEDNFIFVAIYISFINSFLEEFFFRGFIFLNLLRLKSKWFAYIVSALSFSIYHIAFMSDWFSPALFILAMLGLFTGGVIFNYLNEKNKNIYASWIVHIMANLSINTVGFMMFNLI